MKRVQLTRREISFLLGCMAVKDEVDVSRCCDRDYAEEDAREALGKKLRKLRKEAKS
jgi:hypothetical protein